MSVHVNYNVKPPPYHQREGCSSPLAFASLAALLVNVFSLLKLVHRLYPITGGPALLFYGAVLAGGLVGGFILANPNKRQRDLAVVCACAYVGLSAWAAWYAFDGWMAPAGVGLAVAIDQFFLVKAERAG